MEQENKKWFDLRNAFTGDRMVWGIIAALSIGMVLFSGMSGSALTTVGLGLSCMVCIAAIPPGNYKVAAFPMALVTILCMVMSLMLNVNHRGVEIWGESPFFSHFCLVSLMLCLIIAMASATQDNRLKVAGVGVVIATTYLCMMNNMSYAVFTCAFSMLAMIACGLFRKGVIRCFCIMIVMMLMLVGVGYTFGKTADERIAEGNVSESVVMNQGVQKRLDYIKEYIVNGKKQSDVTKEEVMTDTSDANIYHTVIKRTGTVGAITILGLYIALLLRVMSRVGSIGSRYVRSLAVCCSIAMLLDVIYVVTVCHNAQIPYPTPPIVQYVMTGIVMSCLCRCNTSKRTTIREMIC